MDVVRGYLELGLRLGRHSTVSSTATTGRARSPTTSAASRCGSRPASLRTRPRCARRCRTQGSTPARTRWIEAQLLGLETVARRLAGEAIAFADEVERCYGVRPQPRARGRLRGGAPRARRAPARHGLARGALAGVAATATPWRATSWRRLSTGLATTCAAGLPDVSDCPRARIDQLRGRSRRAVGCVQLLRGRPAQPDRDQRRPAARRRPGAPAGRARDVSGPPHRARLEGAAARPRAVARSRSRC